jgi:maleate isomerase
MWRPDGWGWRARIGLLVPHADICEEAEFMAMAPPGVSIHTTRVPFRGMGKGGTMAPSIGSNPLSAYLEPPLLDDAAELLAYAPVQCICLAFTNTSFLGNVDDDRTLMKRLEQRTHQIPVIDTCLAVLAAVQVVGARRLALINPPWVDAAMTQGGAAYFGGAGLEVVFAQSAELPNNPRDVHPGTLFEWTRANVPASAEVVFVGGNGFRAIGMIEALEEDLKRPVLTANQVLFWYVLRRTGSSAGVSGYGRIFDEQLPVSA